MKSMKKLIFVLFMIMATGGCFSDKGSQSKNDPPTQKEAKQTYTCPMHPQIQSDHPGQCPICGMDLVPAKSHEKDSKEDKPLMDGERSMPMKPEGRSEIHLTPQKQQLIGVEIAKVQERKMVKIINAPGRVAFDPELYTAQNEYLEALKQWSKVKDSPLKEVRENTQEMIRSSRIRLKVLGLSEDQIKELANKGYQSEGLLVSDERGGNWIYADVFEVDLPYIEEGESAKITAPFLQGKTLYGKVASVDQVINPKTRSAKIRIKLNKTDKNLRPESYVNVEIFSPLGTHKAVPIESILDTGRETFVFVKKGDGYFTPHKVKTVFETEEYVAISNGVEVDDEVVVGANFMLDSEARLKSVMQQQNKNMKEHDH